MTGQNLRLICRLSNQVRIHLFSPFLALNVLYWSQKSGQRSLRLRVVLNACDGVDGGRLDLVSVSFLPVAKCASALKRSEKCFPEC